VEEFIKSLKVNLSHKVATGMPSRLLLRKAHAKEKKEL
jgi:hypothetical protein